MKVLRLGFTDKYIEKQEPIDVVFDKYQPLGYVAVVELPSRIPWIIEIQRREWIERFITMPRDIFRELSFDIIILRRKLEPTPQYRMIRDIVSDLRQSRGYASGMVILPNGLTYDGDLLEGIEVMEGVDVIAYTLGLIDF
ncbi:hypothetical protein D1T48_gp19 [Thermoproteus tenax virus 1]|uniref:Coat protein TP2 n=1 Tax=Thermoproteus tenax virus 1 (strain KRA1) TaxID=10480 RepID=COA2_TTV1K|nr:hypothetical protein D1T48_gp19 [Thermoproteus tenax virus 1]P19271.1 RecName: Full=Coat protein TP2 [Thermoproteus tenax virus 1 (STRAIN KRA1)]CAA32987.1 unnamed protein product [Thermoproteus tenax virus 1]